MGECWPLMSGLVSTQHPALPTPAVWQVILKETGWPQPVPPGFLHTRNLTGPTLPGTGERKMTLVSSQKAHWPKDRGDALSWQLFQG